MVSQHPDHAGKPYWQQSDFIDSQAEIEECFRSFSDLNADEYMWDWEGKFVDEAVIERLFHTYGDFFKTHHLGKDIFLTFRVPHFHNHTDHRLGRALLAIKTAAGLTKSIGFHSPPLVELIVPLVESASDMLEIHEAYDQLQSLNHRLFKFDTHHPLGVIPIFEQIDTLFKSGEILHQYATGYKARYHQSPAYIRPFSARSDPALNSGLVPAVIANKVALNEYNRFTIHTGIPVYPIIGPGALPFRGHFNPERIADFFAEYPSIHTAVVQGAFRYDWPIDVVTAAIKKLKSRRVHLPQTIDKRKAQTICDIFTKTYKTTVEKIAPQINHLASTLPKRRERVLHIGLFGYSRETAGVKLPRAIGFTAALYSLGAPPEIIGTGRGLQELRRQGLLPYLETYYHHLKADLQFALKYYNSSAVSLLAKENSAWNDVIEDARLVREYLSSDQNTIHANHHRLSYSIAKSYLQLPKEKITKLVTKAAVIRRSLG